MRQNLGEIKVDLLAKTTDVYSLSGTQNHVVFHDVECHLIFKLRKMFYSHSIQLFPLD